MINDRNRQKRLKFAREYRFKDETSWRNIIFCDDFKFNGFGWRKPNEELKCGNVELMVKHGGGSVMVW